MNDSVQPQRENVVPLNPERRQPATVSLARLPAAMHSVRDRARQTLQGLLRDLFDKADDSLFELADQATSNQEQNLYFDSMREVRLQRRTLEHTFFLGLDRGFAALLEPGESNRQQREEASLEELSLVQNDELEQMVATESMVNKANEQFAEAVQHLTLRMDQLVPVKVYQKNNPLGADAICTGFTEAAKALKIDVKAKLVLFKLFDKWVVSRLGSMYESVNQQLIDANILPSLKAGAPAARRQRAGAQPSRAARAERAQREDESNQVLHTLRDLLSNQGGASQSQDSGAGESLDTQDLVHLLSQAQQQDWASLDQGADAVNVPQLVRGLVKNTRRQSLNQVDEDVINLVSMMFEFILDDRNLASPMKALLGRLQIPLIKVAIADKSFFSKGGHPARRLLNELAMAALGWQDTGEEGRRKDTFYQKVDQIVQTILAEFESDVGIFDRMLLDFRAYQEKERRRARILEQRTLDAEDGKARSERARAEVDAALKRLTQGQTLAVAANTLLYEAWSKVLFIICLKQGTDSDDWREALESAEQLVWSATAPMDRDNRQKLLKLVPELLPQLRAGLESIAYNPYEMNQLFKQLEQLHLSRLREASQPAPAAEPSQRGADPVATETVAAEPEPVPEANAEAAADEAAQAPVFQVVEEPSAASDEASSQADSSASGAEDSTPIAEGLVSSAEGSLRTDEGSVSSAEGSSAESTPSSVMTGEVGVSDDGPLPASDPHMALVSNLTQGSWFERQDEQGQAFRCRLAAMIKPTGKYIFVNRSGMKVAEETREGLARALKSGRMRILDDGMLFDRALEAVIGNLRSSRAR